MSGKSGLTPSERLQAGHVAAKKSSGVAIPVGDAWFPARTDPEYGILAHPREFDVLDEAMVEDIISRFRAKLPNPIEHEGLFWDVGPDPVSGKRRVLTINGCRRIMHGREAQRRLHDSGELPKDACIYVGVAFWKPPKDASDAEAKAAAVGERLRANADPLKKPDSARVLADQAAALVTLGWDVKRIAGVMPPGVTPREVDALLRFDNLHPDARAAFDGGAPVGLLSAVLDAPREEQAAKVATLQAKGLTTQKGVSRAEGREKKAAEGQPAQKLNGKIVAKATDFLARKAQEWTGDTIEEGKKDERLALIVVGMLFAQGHKDALTDVLDLLSEADQTAFKRAIGIDKSTGRPRGRPRKNPAPATT